MTTKQYGPEVLCTLTGQPMGTHRPQARGPWFCMVCGASDHAVIVTPAGDPSVPLPSPETDVR